jgi:hypothetical protein
MPGAAPVDGAHVGEILIFCEGESDFVEEPVDLSVEFHSEK